MLAAGSPPGCWHTWNQRADGAYARGGAMLRRLHETTAGHPLAAGRECVIHGDPGPFNTIFQQGLPTAFIDWSSCRPGDRLDDLGYLAWTWCIQSEGQVPIAEQARHLRELRDGYGDTEPEILLDAMMGSHRVGRRRPRAPPRARGAAAVRAPLTPARWQSRA